MSGLTRRIWPTLWPVLLPLLIAAYPPLLLYASNAGVLRWQSLARILILTSLLAIVLYVLFAVVGKKPLVAAIAAFQFIVFFNNYGAAYDYLSGLDVLPIQHSVLLPIFVILGLGAAWLVLKLDSTRAKFMWIGLSLLLAVPVVFNVTRIMAIEADKRAAMTANASAAETAQAPAQAYPDIYFIIFDEFSGFEPMREYWHNDVKVNAFVGFLKANGFAVAEQSHSSSIFTLHQMATRLNYEEFPCDPPGSPSALNCANKDLELYYEGVSQNKVMRYLKAKGYSTVLLEEVTSVFEAMPPIVADYHFRSEAEAPSGLASWFDQFGVPVADATMLRAFSAWYSGNEFSFSKEQHRRTINYTIQKIGDLDEVPAPRFVYVHLYLPHKPFMFDEKGEELPPKYHWDWNYYLGQYNYSMKVARKIVQRILDASDPARPPVIILQSDHGARNRKTNAKVVVLKNYPKEFTTSIMFALHMPGFDPSDLPQDVNPDNTFPIVFNHVFGDDIPLAK